jgi:23S rRNA pseudouridine955/2504/2580 synthase
VQHVTIDATHSGQRLDNFLIGRLKGVPRSRIYRILRTGEVRLNGGRAQPARRLQEGDIVRVPPVRTAISDLASVPRERFAWLDDRILYEDDSLLAIDKPAGLSVHGGTRVSIGLIEALRGRRGDESMLELVHRLDRETSGCLLLAKQRPALLALHDQWRAGKIEKRYLALLRGRWRGGARSVELDLERSRARKAVVVQQGGKRAASRFMPRQFFADATLLEIQLLTGRTHQARAHAAHLGYPIAGDPKYGDRQFNRSLLAQGLRRMFLHAASLSFTHPVHGDRIRIESPLAPELSQILQRLEHAS